MNRQIASLHEVLPAELTGVNGGTNPALYSVTLYGNPVPTLHVGGPNPPQFPLIPVDLAELYGFAGLSGV
jgi:hypothetical protein